MNRDRDQGEASREAAQPRPFRARPVLRPARTGTTVTREVRGGLTTFVTMAYLVILIPLIIGDAKDVTGATLNPAQLTTMVALSAGLSTVLMGLVGNAPLAMAAGLGVTPIVVFQAAPHVTWPQAMGLVVLEGVLIVVFALTGIRQLIMDAIPLAIKRGSASASARSSRSSGWWTPGSSATTTTPRHPSSSVSSGSSWAGRCWCSASAWC